MKNEVTVSSPITFAAQFRATRAIVARNRITPFVYAFFVGVPALTLLAMLATGYDLTRPSLLDLPVWGPLLGGPVYVFLFQPLLHALTVWQQRRKNPSVTGVLTFVLNSEGLETHGHSFDVRMRWDAIHRVIETRQFFLFYVASATAYFLPKTCVASPEELQLIRDIVSGAIRDRAKLN